SGNSATGFDFAGHHFPGKGGGLFNGGDTLTPVRDSHFICNSAELGGAIFNNAEYGTLDVRGSTFFGNSASDSGGALYNQRGPVTIQDSTLPGNSAGSAGGGLYNGAFGTLAIKDSGVSGNVAPSGADVYNLGALALNDSTVGLIGP